MYEHNMSKFIVKNKEDFTFEEYKAKFYRTLRMYNQKYDEEQFEDLLTELYMKEPEVYDEWVSLLRKIPYFFIRNNTVLTTALISSNNTELMVTAYEMDKKKKSILARTLPMRATSTTVNENKEKLLLEYKKLSLLIVSENDDNIVRKAKEEFAKCYGEYANDPYLSDYYNDILNNFEAELTNCIDKEINKVIGIGNKLTNSNHISTVVDDIQHAKRNHKKAVFFKSTLK